MSPRPRLLALAAGSLLVCLSQPAAAEYFGFDMADGTDMFYMETRYPAWTESTYNARFSSHVVSAKKDGPSTYFYSGPAYNTSPTPEANNGYIWSFWPVSRAVTPGDAVRPVLWAPDFQSPLSIGEGASGKIDGKIPMKTQQWYGGLIRVWQPSDGATDHAFISQWFKDGVTGNWKHLGTMHLPFDATALSGMGGFIEDFSHGNRYPRRVDFRNAYHHAGGVWKPSKTFTCSTRQKTEKGDSALIENGTAAFFETCSGDDYKGTMGPGPIEKKWTLSTPETPAFDELKLARPSALAVAGQVMVEWAVPESSAPQFSYKIEVFPTAAATGEPLATLERRDPGARSALVAVPGLKHGAKAFVKLTLTDIFDKPAKPVVLPAGFPSGVLNPSGSTEKQVGGLQYRYFENAAKSKDSAWTAIPDFSKLEASRSGGVNGLDLSVSRRHTNYALKYDGLLAVPAGGIWKFYLKSSDGSRLVLGDKPVIDFDGVHSTGEIRSGWAALKQGSHKVEVQFFKGAGGGQADLDLLELEWEGPGTPRGLVPESAWRRVPAMGEPAVRLVSPAAGAPVTGSNARLAAAVSNKTAGEIQFYSGDTLWARTQDGGTEVKALLGNGPNHLRARLVYDGNKTVDSPTVDVTVANQAFDPWQFTPVGTRAFPAAAGAADGKVSIVGDGMNLVWQPIEGDATIIAHTAEKPEPSKGSQEDGSKFTGDWKGGIIFRDNLNANTSNPPGDHFVALYGEVDGSIHLQSHDDHNPGGPISGPNLNNGGFTWLKLERKGDTFTASLSTDGQSWTVAGTRTAKLPARTHAGLFTLARPSPNPNPHWWKFDSVKLGAAQ